MINLRSSYNLIISILILVFIPSCKQSEKSSIALGNPAATTWWIYLCGLTSDFDAPQEIENRNILNQIGKSLNLGILVIKPQHRCAEYDNKLCWPHESQDQTIQTYNEVMQQLHNTKIAGWIGFSNGGFFLNQLIQHVDLAVPVISIGAAGYMHQAPFANRLYLLIGKNDTHHYELTKKLYQQAKNSALKVTLVEYEGSHAIDKVSLQNVLMNITRNSYLPYKTD